MWATLSEMLDTSSTLWLAVTLGAYLVGLGIYRKTGDNPLLNPAIIAAALVIAAVAGSGTAYDTYFQGAYLIHFMLGPATVALAVPLYQHLGPIRRQAKALLIALACGSVTAAGGAVLIGWALGANDDILLALSTKSITTPIAIGVSEAIGGSATLAVAFVIMTGISTIIYGPWLLTRFGLTDAAGQGWGIGTVAHGIGTARAFQIDQTAGTYAGLAMGVNGVLSAFLLPLIYSILGS